MKVAIIGTFLGQKTSGAEISSFLLIKNLQKNNDVFAVTTKITHALPFQAYSLPKVEKVPNHVLLIGHTWLDSYMQKELIKIFHREKPDIVHIQDSSMMIAAVRAAKQCNIPTVFTVRDYRFTCNLSIPLEKGTIPFKYTKSEYNQWLYQSFKQAYNKGWISYVVQPWFWTQNQRLLSYFKRIDQYITVSDFVRRQVITMGINPAKVSTVKVQKEEWIPLKIKKETDHPLIFTGGGLKATKGFGQLITAFTNVVKKYPQAQLRIAGDGSLRKKLELLCEKLGLSNNVTFLGNIDHQKMRDEYARADFIVSPSLWPEPLSRIIFEAFTLKKTIIATDVGGSKELVMNNKTGILVKPHDISSLASAMLLLIENKTLRQKLADNAYKLINKECADKMNLQNHIKIYQDVIQTAKATRIGI